MRLGGFAFMADFQLLRIAVQRQTRSRQDANRESAKSLMAFLILQSVNFLKIGGHQKEIAAHIDAYVSAFGNQPYI